MTALANLRRRASRRPYLSDAHVRALQALAHWPQGMPAINAVAPAGVLAHLERLGLAQRLAPDAIGDDRFCLTLAGAEALANAGDPS